LIVFKIFFAKPSTYVYFPNFEFIALQTSSLLYLLIEGEKQADAAIQRKMYLVVKEGKLKYDIIRI
jgi:hypothetical protein